MGAIGDYEAAEAFLAEAAVELSSIDSLVERSHLLESRGNLAIYKGEFDKAENLLKQSLPLHHKLDNYRRIGSTLHMLGQLSRLQGNFHTAQDYFQKALDISQDQNLSLKEILWSMGNLAVDQQKFSEAMDCLLYTSPSPRDA